MRASESGKLQCRNRWFAYFNLLEFSNLVRQKRIEHVLPIYEDILKAITEKTELKCNQGISYSWFSDTFIIFSRGDSENEFAYIEHVSRLFFQKLILSKIPVRGSLTIGPLYIQQKKNIFLGEALIDANEYGEKQNWLGFILTPSVYKHLNNSSLKLPNRAHYRLVKIPGIISHPISENIYAFAFNNGQVNGENLYLKVILEMKVIAGKKYSEKYTNTELFIRKDPCLDLKHKEFNRLTISRFGFKKCKEFLGILSTKKYGLETVEYEALLISAIIAYSRPFSGNEKDKNARATSKVDKIILRELTKDELEFHEKIIKLRNTAIAHIEWKNSPTSIDEHGTISTIPFSLLNKFGTNEEIIKFQGLVEKILSETHNSRLSHIFNIDQIKNI